ncbi:hypothetical protein JYB87_03345 [Shewanella avicenniae]|uniref:N-acetyltransferase domain-containing protein n=1 Tax=Shewanella avicenniae TaxID=2814294 RepID=A0ABX7QTP9_9GAMM|nr:hypothetical protein [Shewanella avicenniae]QSX34301.1 hypothetical protein JYB87_03345 [Shewanella avicenniae]
MQIKCADKSDIPVIKALEKLAVSDEFSEIELRQGVSGDFFDEQQLQTLVAQRAIWLIFDNASAVGYLVFAKFDFHQHSPLYRQLHNRCSGNRELGIDWQHLNVCGPVWLHQRARGKGAFQQLYAAAKAKSSGQVIALIAEHNSASIKAHCRAANMQIIDFQTLSGRDFYLLLG